MTSEKTSTFKRIKKDMLVKQGISEETLKQMKSVYDEMDELFKQIEKEEDASQLKVLANKIPDLEYRLQELWGFRKDSRYHRYWFKAPKCTCPVLDNLDNLGTDIREISPFCPLHGGQKETDIWQIKQNKTKIEGS